MKHPMRILLTALCLLGLSTAQANGIAKIQSIDAKLSSNQFELSLEVLQGALYNDDAIDIFQANSRIKAKIKLPNGIDMLMAGDKLGKVIVSAPIEFAAGSYLTSAEAFATLADVQLALGNQVAPASAPASNNANAIASSVIACPYTSAQLSQILKVQFEQGKGNELPYPGGVSLSCTYSAKTDFFKLIVNQNVMSSGTIDTGAWQQQLAGSLQAIANDPNQAHWQVDQGDLSGVVLHYARQGTLVEIRWMPGHAAMKDAAKVVQWRKAILQLPRLPIQ